MMTDRNCSSFDQTHLHVIAGVPVRVKQQHPVRPGQVDAQTPHSGREKEDKDVGIEVEVVHQP